MYFLSPSISLNFVLDNELVESMTQNIRAINFKIPHQKTPKTD